MASILIIDGPGEPRESMAAALRDAGHVVRIAGGGAEGLMAFAKGQTDLVICELLLQPMDGLEVVANLRRQAPDLPVMATTKGNSACAPGYLLGIAAANGVNATLQKPFSAAELLAAVSEALSGGVETPFAKIDPGASAPKARASLRGGVRDRRNLRSD